MSARASAARGKVRAPPAKGKQFSDDNKSWLKPAPAGKKRSLFEEEEDDEDDDEDEEEESGEEEDEEEESGEEEDEEEDAEEDGDEDDSGEEDELEFERKARRTVAKLSANAAANEKEMREQLQSQSVLPSMDELAEEQQHPPDISNLRDRVKTIAEVLSDFSNRREVGRARHEYVAVFASDLSTVYGYSAELIELLLGLFSPAEALSFIEASETPRPVTVRASCCCWMIRLTTPFALPRWICAHGTSIVLLHRKRPSIPRLLLCLLGHALLASAAVLAATHATAYLHSSLLLSPPLPPPPLPPPPPPRRSAPTRSRRAGASWRRRSSGATSTSTRSQSGPRRGCRCTSRPCRLARRPSTSRATTWCSRPRRSFQ